MEEGILELKWSNHKVDVLEHLKVIRKKSNYTDATLAVDGKFYPVHRLIMSLFSDYFRDIFEQTSCKSPVIFLKDVQTHEIEALLDYIYLGEVHVNQNDLASLLKLAECLGIKGLAAVPDENSTKIFKSSTSSHDGIAQGSPPPKRRRQDSNTISQSALYVQSSSSAFVSHAQTHSVTPNSTSKIKEDEILNFVKVEMDDAEESDISIPEHEVGVKETEEVPTQKSVLKNRGRKSKFSSDQDNILVEFFSSRPYFWDKADPYHLYATLKDEELSRQAFEMGTTASELTSWFRSQRTLYGRYKKEIRESASGACDLEKMSDRKRWNLTNFQFLDQHIKLKTNIHQLGQGHGVQHVEDDLGPMNEHMVTSEGDDSSLSDLTDCAPTRRATPSGSGTSKNYT